jgi:anti-repressor protein
MSELIKVVEKDFHGAKVKTCDGRELWTCLHSKQEFANWAKARIKKYGYVEGVDYLVEKTIKNLDGGRPAQEYTLTLDVTKELAMVESNDEGRSARLYFIECERRLLAQPSLTLQLPDFTNPAAAARAWADSVEEVQVLALENAKAAAIVQAFETLTGTEGTVCLRDAAKDLNLSPGKFTLKLEMMQWLYRRNRAGGKKGSVKAMQTHIDARHLVHKMVATGISSSTGLQRYEPQVRVTGMGMARLALLLGCSDLALDAA